MDIIKDPVYQPSQGPATHLIIFLHGYGATGDDLLSLSHGWASCFPEPVFLGLEAPEPCEVSPLGRQWFSLKRWDTPFLRQGADHATPPLMDRIHRACKNYHIEKKNVFLVGFSQGAMMALHCALSSSTPLGGVLGFSGACLWPDDRPYNRETPILLVHGQEDDVVPIEAFHHAKSWLEHHGLSVQAHTLKGLGHGIDDRGVQWGYNFFLQHRDA